MISPLPAGGERAVASAGHAHRESGFGSAPSPDSHLLSSAGDVLNGEPSGSGPAGFGALLPAGPPHPGGRS